MRVSQETADMMRKEAQEWTITDDPDQIKYERNRFQIDLTAEIILAAQKDHQQITVEIKSFLNPSAVEDFYETLLSNFLLFAPY